MFSDFFFCNYYYLFILIHVREGICSCFLVFVLSPARAAKKIASWGDISDQKARESQMGEAVLDSVPGQTTISNFAENRYQQEMAYSFRCGSGSLLFTAMIGSDL